jgi:hypothetical protein
LAIKAVDKAIEVLDEVLVSGILSSSQPAKAESLNPSRFLGRIL